MKKLCIAVVMIAALVASLETVGLAQSQRQDSSGSSHDAGRNRLSPEQMVQLLATKLNLTEDQRSQLTPIIANRQEQLQALRSDTSIRPFQKKRKMKSIFEESDKKIKAVLNDEQKKQYAELEQQMREQMKERARSRRSSE